MTEDMRCCSQCFGDASLAKVVEEKSVQQGTCSFCASVSMRLVEPSSLRDLFELVLGIYTRHDDEGGEPLVTWLRNDWAMFEHERMDDAHAKELLAEVLDDGDIVRYRFVPQPEYVSDAVQRWGEFREELRCRNRFFPNKKADVDSLKQWLPLLAVGPGTLASTFYRTRIQQGDKPIPLHEMGAPPATMASNGRANPVGIPYLYLGSDVTTTIAEVRPHTGEVASVATFKLDGDLTLVDLRTPRRTVSPFLLADEQQVGALRRSLDLLSLLGEELTRPVLPSSAPIDYLPSQYLCEFIKHCGYDGVLYRSSVGDGFNLALFEPAKARALSVECYRVDRVSVSISPS